jgi:segregation and condensation protein B
MNDETTDIVEPAAPEPGREPLDLNLVKRVLEAALLSASEPLTVPQLKRLFAGELDADSLRKILEELKEEWAGRAVELTAVASGWRFRVKPDYQRFLDRISSERPPRVAGCRYAMMASVSSTARE